MAGRRRLAVGAVVGVVLLGLVPVGRAQVPDGTLGLTAPDLLAIANVDLPPTGTMLQIHADFPEDAPLMVDGTAVYAVTADLAPDGTYFVRSAVTDQDSSTQLEAAGPCQDPAFMSMGVVWSAEDLPVEWKLNMRSFPARNSRFQTKRAIRKAHQVWPRIHTDCRDRDANDFRFFYLEPTRKRVKYDGVNVVDFGRLGSGALAVNYTWYRNTRIVEVDLRLNKSDYRWTNNPDGKRGYHVINVVTHELGHQLGLDDLSQPHRGLTMYGRINKGELDKVTLGKGDIKGAATLSP